MSLRLISVLVVFISLGLDSLAQAEWVSFDGQDVARPEIKIDQQTGNRLQMEISIGGVEMETVAIGETNYSQIRIPGHWFTLDQGQPELPFITSSLIIPDEGTPVVRVIESTWRKIGINPALPSKGNIDRTVNPATIPYSLGSVYDSDGVFPASEVTLARPFIMRDYRGVSVRVNAVRWDAGNKQLLALESMTLEVITSGGGGVNTKRRTNKAGQPESLDKQYSHLYSQGFANFQKANKYNMVVADGRMLVVCHDSFLGVIQPFIEWKRSMGFDVELISTGSVGGTTSGIQSIIDARYAEPDGLTYVILVGDQAQVPSYSGTYEAADDDTRYGNLEGDDFYPDLFVSRISGSNPADIQTQINKFIRYERDPDSGADWYHTGVGIASDLGTPTDLERAGWLREDLLNYNFTQVHEVYQPEGSTSDISAALNSGVSMINYIGHGTGSAWNNPVFGVQNIQALTNGWKNPWILDVSCSNGDFSQDECFAESWLRAGGPEQPQGAIATYSASTTTPWVPPCVMQAEVVDLLVADQANALGSLYYHGMMKVMDEYPGNVQLVEQYNIFGDCSLMVRTSTPVIPNMSYDDVIPIGGAVFPVDTGLENCRVAIYSNGQLHGVGVTDVNGHVDVLLTSPVTDPGEVTMTVTGYNLLTQVITLQAEIPVQVTIQPAEIRVGRATQVIVTLADPAKEKSINNVTVTIEGFGVSNLEAVTDFQGVAVFNVNPQYGEILVVRGVESGTTHDLFKRGLTVSSFLDLTNIEVNAEVADFGMVGTLAANHDGSVSVTSDVANFNLLLNGPGIDLNKVGSGTALVEIVTPNSTGVVYATVFKPGYNIYQEEIDVISANGTLAGTVALNGTGEGLVGARVLGFHAGDDPAGTPLFDLLTDASGVYSVPTQMPAGSYDLYTVKFGYSDYAETFTLMHGVNNHPVLLELAPRGVVNGLVTAVSDGSPVDAIVQIFRLDTNVQMTQITTNELGEFTSPELPFYDYQIVVKAYLFEVQSVNISIHAPVVNHDFGMSPTVGKILVVDHSSTRGTAEIYQAKTGKGGVILSEGFQASGNKAASDLITDLSALNFTVDQMPSDNYNFENWGTYDLVLVSAGNNGSNFSAILKNDMLSFVAAGGQLLVEGGEVGYNNRTDVEFRSNVLHISSWSGDFTSSLKVKNPGHAVMSEPNAVSDPLDLLYAGYTDSDIVVAISDATWPGSWSNAETRASVVCYDPNPAPEGGQIVFFPFNYSALTVDGRIDLLHNAIVYLSIQEIGTATIGGRVQVHGATDDSEVILTLTPGYTTFETGPDGVFTFFGLLEGQYQITASRSGFSSSVTDLVVNEGQPTTRVLYLDPIITNTFCSEPNVEIPDNDPDGGVYSIMTIDNISSVTELGVFVDISHPSVPDLVIDLISPSGETVRLQQNNLGADQGLVGWYPDDLVPHESLNAFVGESIQGDWRLHVMDVGPQDVGQINSWCLVLTYAEIVVSPVQEDLLPRVVSMDGNYPNPFNPMTVIRFSLPKNLATELAVYDVRGVRIRTLINDVLEAGHHQITWTGRDDAGRQVSSGTYFYRLNTGGQNLVGKMLLLK